MATSSSGFSTIATSVIVYVAIAYSLFSPSPLRGEGRVRGSPL
jgi:hypothetical protein